MLFHVTLVLHNSRYSKRMWKYNVYKSKCKKFEDDEEIEYGNHQGQRDKHAGKGIPTGRLSVGRSDEQHCGVLRALHADALSHRRRGAATALRAPGTCIEMRRGPQVPSTAGRTIVASAPFATIVAIIVTVFAHRGMSGVRFGPSKWSFRWPLAPRQRPIAPLPPWARAVTRRMRAFTADVSAG